MSAVEPSRSHYEEVFVGNHSHNIVSINVTKHKHIAIERGAAGFFISGIINLQEVEGEEIKDLSYCYI